MTFYNCTSNPDLKVQVLSAKFTLTIINTINIHWSECCSIMYTILTTLIPAEELDHISLWVD